MLTIDAMLIMMTKFLKGQSHVDFLVHSFITKVGDEGFSPVIFRNLKELWNFKALELLFIFLVFNQLLKLKDHLIFTKLIKTSENCKFKLISGFVYIYYGHLAHVLLQSIVYRKTPWINHHPLVSSSKENASVNTTKIRNAQLTLFLTVCENKQLLLML